MATGPATGCLAMALVCQSAQRGHGAGEHLQDVGRRGHAASNVIRVLGKYRRCLRHARAGTTMAVESVLGQWTPEVILLLNQ